MDAGKYYALLRFEEAAQALRAAFKLRIVDVLGDRTVTMASLQEEFGFTVQATRTYVALLEVMEILHRDGQKVSVSARARECLAEAVPTSRRPYLAMGMGEEVDAYIGLLRGQLAEGSLPLYAGDDVAETIMDLPEVAEEIAHGLSSRARNFAGPLADAIKPHAAKARILADIGAGSPYVAAASLAAMPNLTRAILVDRANGMRHARSIADQNGIDLDRIEQLEQDFFKQVPPADVYCISNTAHDWLPEEYSTLMTNVRDSIAPGGVICIHEPLLAATWNSAEEWVQALWMACYAMTLFRLTEGKGTCYTRAEHDMVMADNGFAPIGKPIPTSDGCTALFYGLASEVPASHATEMRSMQQPSR